MSSPVFEDTAPADYLTRLAASDWGRACKQLAAAYWRFMTDRVVRNAAVSRQLPWLAAAAGLRPTRVISATAVFRDVRAADHVLGLRRVTARAATAGYLTPEQAGPWLDHLASQLFVAVAVAA